VRKLPLYIHRTGNYYERVDGEPPELKALVQETLGVHVRRVGRFIQLALIGAGRCAGQSLPQDTAVFLTSGRGDLEVTMDVLEQLFVHAQPPKPLSFINTVSNAACYYIAQQLKLQSRSGFACNRHFAFESALQLAVSDFEQGIIRSALVGTVDVVVPPFENGAECRLHGRRRPPRTLGGGGDDRQDQQDQRDRPRHVAAATHHRDYSSAVIG